MAAGLQDQAALLAFDAVVCAADEVASPQEHAHLRAGLFVDASPPVVSAHELSMLPMALKDQALHLLMSTEVVTTEAHVLVARMIGPPPTFLPAAAPLGLDARQAQFAARVPQLASCMRAMWRAEGNHLLKQALPAPQQNASMHTMLHDVHALVAALPNAQAPMPRVIVDPYMAFNSGGTAFEAKKGALVVLGPSDNAQGRETLLAHELLHPQISTLVAATPDLAQAIASSACVFEALKSDARAHKSIRDVYGTWQVYWAESAVRGISRQMTGAPLAVDDGFVLAASFGHLAQEMRGRDAEWPRAFASQLRRLKAQYCPAF